MGRIFFYQGIRSEDHTSELQSLTNLVCRLLLEKKKNRCPAARRASWTTATHARTPSTARGRRSRAPSASAVDRMRSRACYFFFFNNTATPEIYPLPLRDALPF